MRTTLARVLLLASIASCTETETETETESTETSNLYGIGFASPRWGNASGASIPVCWDDPYAHMDLQIRTREILRETWESYANIFFMGPSFGESFGGLWAPCSEITGRKVRVVFSEMPDYRGNTAVGPDETTVTLISDDALGENYGRFRYEVIHEFGHALGFVHEMQRPDNWPYGTAMQCLASDTSDTGNYEPVTGGIYLTPTYDVNSIMNYCNPASGFPQDLSLGDIRGVRAAYGRRDVKGDIYKIDDADQLHWYRHDGRSNGSAAFAYPSGTVVGTGWGFKTLFSGGGSAGILYGVDANNTLTWWRHDGRVDGGFRWAYGSGTPVGWGWDFATLFGAGDGVIYGISPRVPAHYDTVGSGGGGNLIPASGGDLYWYRNLGQANGTKSWAAGSGKSISHGWGGFKKVFSGGDGVIYGVDNSDQLYWYRHDGRDTGGSQWAAGSGTPVGSGWSFQHLVGDD